MKSLEKCRCGFSDYGEAYPKGIVCKVHNPSKLVCFHCKQSTENTSYLNDIGWSIAEFADGWFPICSNCRELFEPEDITIHGWKAEIAGCAYNGCSIMIRNYKLSNWYNKVVINRHK